MIHDSSEKEREREREREGEGEGRWRRRAGEIGSENLFSPSRG
jgi:hypothetical protein